MDWRPPIGNWPIGNWPGGDWRNFDFESGDEVRVSKGMFKGFSGAVAVVNRDWGKVPRLGKVTVQIELWGRIAPVELGWSQLEKL